MSSYGIGFTIGLGAIIGLAIVGTTASMLEYVMTFLVYGLMSGFVIEMYFVALRGLKPPFGSKRP
jgi:hypothetical protein